MGQLPNPNQSKPFDRVIKNPDGEAVFGIRNEHTPEEEIVNLQTGESNQKYWQPDPVISPNGCDHALFLVDKREVECQWCHWAFPLHVNNIIENKDGAFTTYRGKQYKIQTSS